MDTRVMFHLHTYSGQKQRGAEQRGTHLRESIPVRSVCPVGEEQEGRVRRGKADIRVKNPWERLKPKADQSTDEGGVQKRDSTGRNRVVASGLYGGGRWKYACG